MNEIAAFRLGTRGSKLALAQAKAMQAMLRTADPSAEVEIVAIRTSGDQGNRDQLGAFVHELQIALLDRRIDIALHCLKDIPTERVRGLGLAAYILREDPRDALIGPEDGIERLPANAVVGTGSLRRSSQLAAIRPDLTFKPLLGNIDTRLRKLVEGEYHAIVLAMAGLERLGLMETWADSEYRRMLVEPLAPSVMLPAPGQAVLVLECREGDPASTGLCAPLNHVDTEAAATAERAFLKAFGGGCSVPVAALASLHAGRLELSGLVASPDGKSVIRGTRRGSLPDAEPLGAALAQELGEQGAFEIIRTLAVAAV